MLGGKSIKHGKNGATDRVIGLAETRRRRLAHVTGDLVPGVNAIAAPIFDEKGRIAAAIGALGRPEDLDVDFGGKVAAALARTAEEISRRLGYSPHE
jgi:DNA-binding IclR family transcriptional regulator